MAHRNHVKETLRIFCSNLSDQKPYCSCLLTASDSHWLSYFFIERWLGCLQLAHQDKVAKFQACLKGSLTNLRKESRPHSMLSKAHILAASQAYIMRWLKEPKVWQSFNQNLLHLLFIWVTKPAINQLKKPLSLLSGLLTVTFSL